MSRDDSVFRGFFVLHKLAPLVQPKRAAIHDSKHEGGSCTQVGIREEATRQAQGLPRTAAKKHKKQM